MPITNLFSKTEEVDFKIKGSYRRKQFEMNVEKYYTRNRLLVKQQLRR